jgi:hypothetical protein
MGSVEVDWILLCFFEVYERESLDGRFVKVDCNIIWYRNAASLSRRETQHDWSKLDQSSMIKIIFRGCFGGAKRVKNIKSIGGWTIRSASSESNIGQNAVYRQDLMRLKGILLICDDGDDG